VHLSLTSFSNTIETEQIVVEVDEELLDTTQTGFNTRKSVNWTVIKENRK